jgi:hypothetical protein
MKRITVKEVDGILHVTLGKFLLKMKPHAIVNGFFRLNDVHDAIKGTVHVPKGKKLASLAPSQWYRPDPSTSLKMFLDHIHVEGEPYPIKVINGGLTQGAYGTQAVVERYIQWINETPRSISDGYIYIFYLKKLNQCKIGFSGAVGKRQLEISSQIGVHVTRIYESPRLINAYETEQNVHMVVGNYHKRLLGEWFEVKEDDIDEVITIVSSVVESIGVKDV